MYAICSSVSSCERRPLVEGVGGTCEDATVLRCAAFCRALAVLPTEIVGSPLRRRRFITRRIFSRPASVCIHWTPLDAACLFASDMRSFVFIFRTSTGILLLK